jgi:chitinase
MILAFVVSQNTLGGLYPRMNFRAAYNGQTPLIKEEAPGLLFCSKLATDINTCQTTYGKKVLLSISNNG